MIEIGTIGIRYLEAAVLGTMLMLLAALFLRRRPAGLVWLSAAAMGTLAAHLYLEHGRWQLLPAYTLVVLLSFWVGRPSARRYRAPGLVLRWLVAVACVPAAALPLMAPLFLMPAPGGPHPVGHMTLIVNGAPGGSRGGSGFDLHAWYPATAGAQTVTPFWSAHDLRTRRLPGLPPLLTTHLSLVPTPTGHRAPILARPLPLLVMLCGPGSLPGDSLHLALEAASAGWLVVAAAVGADEQMVVRIVESLTDAGADASVAGRIDRDRVALLAAGVAAPDLGLPALTVGGGSLLHAALPSGVFTVGFADAEIPPAALTTRYLMVRPARLLVGSSQIPPDVVARTLGHLVRTVLGDGGAAAPIFSAAAPNHGALLSGAAGAVIRVLPDARR